MGRRDLEGETCPIAIINIGSDLVWLVLLRRRFRVDFPIRRDEPVARTDAIAVLVVHFIF